MDALRDVGFDTCGSVLKTDGGMKVALSFKLSQLRGAVWMMREAGATAWDVSARVSNEISSPRCVSAASPSVE